MWAHAIYANRSTIYIHKVLANIYKNVAKCIQSRIQGKDSKPEDNDFPSIQDGVRGMKFIYKVIESGKSEQKWIDL